MSPRFSPLALLAAPALLAGCIVILPVPLPLPAPAPGAAVAPAGPAAVPPPPAPACPVPAGADRAAAEVIVGLNRLRAAAGLAGVRAAPRLDAAARGHACDNARRGSIGHVGADGAGLATRLSRAGYRHGIAAENTGAGYADGAAALAGWAGSAPHRANLLLAAVREAGLGLARGADGRLHFVLVLAAPR